MSWLRVDDGFTEHRKVVSLKRADRWTWLELLTYCARQGNGGHVPQGVCDVLKWVTPKFLTQCAVLGLLDVEEDGYHVHDWTIYNGDTLGEKVAAYLDRSPSASANEVQRELGGKRELVLALVNQYRVGSQSVPPTGSQEVPGNVLGTVLDGTKVVHARANPSPTPGSTFVEPLEIANRNETWDALTDVFGEAATETARSLRGKIVRSLKGAQATPEQIHRSRDLWRRKMPPETTFTETALEKHWGFLFSEPRREVCEECGTGGGLHAEGCSRTVTGTDIANVLKEIHAHDR